MYKHPLYITKGTKLLRYNAPFAPRTRGSMRLCVRNFLTILFLCLALTSAFAQTTADEIETLLATDAVTYAQAARFVLQAADVNMNAGPEQASPNIWFEYAMDQNWLPKKASANDLARLDGIALLLMRSFDLKGGIWYSITKNPHYAYREIVYQKIIHGRIDPAMPVDGDTLLYMCNRIFSQQEEED